MIIGDQPAHYRYAWEQTQYRQAGDPAYANQRLVDAGGESLLTPADPVLANVEPTSFHHFHIVVAAGPYLPSGFFRADVNETLAQVCQRKGLTQLSQPRLAEFTFQSNTGEVKTLRLKSLRMHVDPAISGWENADTLVTDTAYTAEGEGYLYAVCTVLGAEELQIERPLLLLPIAPAETLPVGSHIRTNWLQMTAFNVNTRWDGFSVQPYRGRN